MEHYQDNSRKLQAAFTGFKAYYQTMYPPPQKPEIKQDKKWVYAGIALIVVCSTLLSGTHSVPKFVESTQFESEIAQLIVAFAAFAGITTAMFIASFLYTKHRFQYDSKNSHPKQIGSMLIIIQVLTFSIEIVANLYSSMDGLGLHPPTEFLMVLSVAIGVSAPVQALVSGHVLGLLVVIDLREYGTLMLKYENDVSAYELQLIAAWDEAQGKKAWKVKVEEAERPQLPEQTIQRGVQLNVQSEQARSSGRNDMSYTVGATRRVQDYLNENEQAWDLSVREIAAILNVSVGTVSAAKNSLSKDK